MKKKIITFASILAISSIGFAKAPDLGKSFQLIQTDEIKNQVTVDDLTGAAVFDKYGVEIGNVYDFEIDPDSAELSTAYLSVGGTFGIGGSYVSLPYDALTYDKAKERFTVESTQSEIKACIDHQQKKMKGHDEMLDHDSENSIKAMWNKVKTNLGVDDDDLAEVEAEIKNGAIHLEGEVRSQALKNNIEKAFTSTTDMKVVNKITVER